ncbi:glycosyltransferase [Wenzhouxiangella sp. 15181]|uniref:glycosyltransferase n=2 Tax=unclassified Wenzhouxiangella TaxID=2613841 RepID=UPI0038D3F8B3
MVFCYAGPLEAQRGSRLIASWARSYDGPPGCLHLMGSEDYRAVDAIESVREEAFRRGLRIVRHGWIEHDKVLEILRSGNIGLCAIAPHVLNYRYSYPIKVVEYMSQGLVPVATDGQGVRTLIRHGETGFVARYGYESFSRAITEAISACQDRDRHKTLLSNMRRNVKHRSWSSLNRNLLLDIETALGTTI